MQIARRRGIKKAIVTVARRLAVIMQRHGRGKDCSISSSNPIVEGPSCRFRREARARELHRHCSRGSESA
jgi:hypothetical protein